MIKKEEEKKNFEKKKIKKKSKLCAKVKIKKMSVKDKQNMQKMKINKLKVVISLLMIAVVNCGTVSGQSTSELDHSIDLDENYRLYWRVIEQDIVFEIQVRTAGYVGFGFSRDGTIYGADLVIGWIDSGHPYFQVGKDTNY